MMLSIFNRRSGSMSESYAGKINRKLLKKRRIINAAAGREPAGQSSKSQTY